MYDIGIEFIFFRTVILQAESESDRDEVNTVCLKQCCHRIWKTWRNDDSLSTHGNIMEFEFFENMENEKKPRKREFQLLLIHLSAC